MGGAGNKNRKFEWGVLRRGWEAVRPLRPLMAIQRRPEVKLEILTWQNSPSFGASYRKILATRVPACTDCKVKTSRNTPMDSFDLTEDGTFPSFWGGHRGGGKGALDLSCLDDAIQRWLETMIATLPLKTSWPSNCEEGHSSRVFLGRTPSFIKSGRCPLNVPQRKTQRALFKQVMRVLTGHGHFRKHLPTRRDQQEGSRGMWKARWGHVGGFTIRWWFWC